jgi:coenzyme F420-reducing hydrogenase gamma subunit
MNGELKMKGNSGKPRIAFIGLTSCKGCFFQFLLLGRRLASVFRNVEIGNFWMLKEFNDSEGRYDITFIDGAVSTDRELFELEKARERTRFLIAYGTCACWGGVPALRNSAKDWRNTVFREETKHKSRSEVTPIDRHVHVDYYMRGCPVNEDEAFAVIGDALAGKIPKEKNYCVCVECKKNGTKCLFKDGVACYGPVTYAGCNAPCPAARTPCDGCRGPLPDGNLGAETGLLAEHGVTREEIESVLSRYSSGRSKPPETPKGAKK